MEESILKSVKKILGIDNSYTAFDFDIITHINTAFLTLTQLGIGPIEGFMITDDTAIWSDFIGDDIQFNPVKSYIVLKTRTLFDPPSSSYLMDAINGQLSEMEWRLSVHRDELVGG